jgi:Tol biopolymer transport system component
MLRLLLALAIVALAGCQAGASRDQPASAPATTAAAPRASAAGVTASPRASAAGPTTAPASASTSDASTWIAFDRANGRDGYDLFLVHPDGSGLQQLAPGDLQVPRWSPDGEWIAVASVHDNGARVLPALVHADGSEYHELEPDPTLSLGAGAWTPDGMQIAFESWDDADPTRAGVYLARPIEGTQLRRIVDRSAVPGGFSPDGSRLAFAADGGSDRRNLGIVKADGTAQQVFASMDVGLYPGFMPDGATIYDTVDGVIGIFDLEGTLVRRIAAPGGTVNEARLRPDGKRFVFMYSVAGEANSIATMDVDGSDLQVVVPPFADEQVAPDWQP